MVESVGAAGVGVTHCLRVCLAVGSSLGTGNSSKVVTVPGGITVIVCGARVSSEGRLSLESSGVGGAVEFAFPLVGFAVLSLMFLEVVGE